MSGKNGLALHADDLRAMGQDASELIAQLGPAKAKELRYNWKFWARENQLPPAIGNNGKRWNTWLILAGRGFGKTRAGAEWSRDQIKRGVKRLACVAPTNSDIKRVAVEGESGWLAVCSDSDTTYKGVHIGKPVWSPTNRTLTWANGAKVEFYSAEEPERLRGPQFEAAWCFVAKTQVETISGSKPCEDVQVGDQVLTSGGYRKVRGTSTRLMPVGTVRFSDGRELTGTYDHPIKVGDLWVPLGSLRNGDFVWTLNTEAKDTISGQTATTLTEMKGCTELSQETLTEQSRVSMSTTLTTTNSTMTRQTCNCSREKSICGCTSKDENSLKENLWENVKSLARVAVLWSKESLSRKLSCVKAVSIKGPKKSEKLSNSAFTVEAPSYPVPENSVVSVVSTWQQAGQQKVYNLSVSGIHEYYANGILTHNCDEICAWGRQRETWEMLSFTLRLGSHPRVCITTTPKSDKLIREILKDPTTAVTYGSTFDNASNLASTYIESVRTLYEGTRLGRQELYAEILDEAAGALWNRELLEKCEVDIKDPVDFAQQLNRVVVSLDPAVTANAESDMTGIIVAGVDSNGTAYVLEDCTDRYTPEGWASKAIDLYNKYSADRIVAEVNQGGDMVRHTLHTIDDSVPYRAVRASRGKMARAEPVSALYERGLVKHRRGLDELENQMVQWEPLGSIGSPDRLDACLAKDTQVLTESGYKPISDVKVGEKVWTREGLKEVEWSGLTRKSVKTLDITLSNGYVIQATPEHPFFVKEKEWVPSGELCVGDELVTEKDVKACQATRQKSSFLGKPTVGILKTLIKQSSDTTYALLERVTKLFTETFGRILTGKSRQATTFTTKTGTTSTTQSRTLSAFPLKNTLKNMLKNSTKSVLASWITQGPLRVLGTEVKKALSFTASLVKCLGSTENQTTKERVSSVVSVSNPSKLMRPSVEEGVLSVASKRTRPTFKVLAALSALKSFCKECMGKGQKPAPVSVVQVSESKSVRDVYNLHVKDCHEFIANGVLVHNCVWAITDLCLGGIVKPELNLAYKSKGLL